ncbi:hypothetical protein YC2023_093366 [Brassica napus]
MMVNHAEDTIKNSGYLNYRNLNYKQAELSTSVLGTSHLPSGQINPTKYLVKITKTRVETVKRKKNSVCKYLKKDIVDLLNNSLDYNAYGRVSFWGVRECSGKYIFNFQCCQQLAKTE